MFRVSAIKTYSTAALAALAIACSGSQPAPAPAPAPAPPPAPKVMTSEEKVKFYQDCWNLFSTKSWDPFKACYTNSATSEMMDSGQPAVTGVDAIMTETKKFTDALPDVKGTLQTVLTNGSTIVGVALINGTQTAPLAGAPGSKPIPATNKPVGYLMAHVFELDPTTGKGTKERQCTNGTLMAQLGLNPAPSRPLMTSGAASPTVAIGTGSEAETKNVEAFRAGIDAFNKHDVKAIEAGNASDGTFHDMTQPKDMDSKGNIAMVGSFFKAFPDATLNLSSIWGAGDYVVAEGTFQGTNKGPEPSMGIKKATGKSVTAHFVEITKMEGGKVKEDWLFYDGMAFATQLGLMDSGTK